jgi:hypothetical protein
LYATDLPASAWPAPEAVELYYGRCGQENRFAQEDRELGLDRIFSYHLPGQELASVVALFLWNWRTTLGFADNPPPERAPTRAARCAVVAEPLRSCDDDETALELGGDASQSPALVDESPVMAPLLDDAAMAATEPPVLDLEPSLRARLAQLPWDEITAALPPNWERAQVGDALRCHAGALLPARAITPARQGRAPRVEFLASLSSCRSCSAQDRCVDATATGSAKKVTRAISTELADALRPLLVDKQAKRARREHDPGRRIPLPSGLSANSAPSPLIMRPDDPAGPFAVVPPLLLPAPLRATAREAFGSLGVRIETVVPRREPRHPALASSSAERQHRRLTWQQRVQRNALGPGASVSIYFDGDPAIVSRHLPHVEVWCLVA